MRISEEQAKELMRLTDEGKIETMIDVADYLGVTVEKLIEEQ